jgi:anti-sigma factor RsiW
MTCESAETYLHQSLDGPLTQEERAALDTHLAECDACRQEREVQRRLVHLADRWADHMLALSDPGDAFNTQVLARLETPPRRSPFSLGLPLAVTLLLLTALAALPGRLENPAWSLAASLGSLPHWLAVNLLALPGDALALQHLSTQPAFVSAWISALLPLTIGVNSVFCLYARQLASRRSMS